MRAIGFIGAVPVGAAAVLEVGRRLGVRWLVTGGYQRFGDLLRITARMVDATTGAVVQSAKIDGAIDDLFGLQDRIATELVADDGTGMHPGRASGRAGPRARAVSPPSADAGAATLPMRRSAPLPPPAAVAAPLSPPSRVVGAIRVRCRGLGPQSRISGLAVIGVIDGPPPPTRPAVISRDERGRATIRAIKLTEGIRLDGQLDEQHSS